MLVCKPFFDKVEETREETTHKWVKQAQKICRKVPWPFNLLCKLVMKLVEIVETVVYTVIKYVLMITCYVIQFWVAVLGAFFKLLMELGERLIGIPDFVVGLLGGLPTKFLRLHVVILRREDGSLTVPQDRVALALERTRQIYRKGARVKVLATVHVLRRTAPGFVLQVKSGVGFFLDQASDTGAWFQQAIAEELPELLPGQWTRIGPVLIAFVVDGVGSTAVGCSSGPLGDYVCVEGARMIVPPQASPVKPPIVPEPPGAVPDGATSVLAHEIGHSCGLLHDGSDTTNLMYPSEVTP